MEYSSFQLDASVPPPAIDQPPLPKFYYLNNFLDLIRSVHQRYFDLLTVKEQEYFDRFLSLPMLSQALFVRLLCRQPRYFRLNKIKYGEIENIREQLTNLASIKLIEAVADPETDEIFRLYTKAEWAVITGVPEYKKYSKLELYQALYEHKKMGTLNAIESPKLRRDYKNALINFNDPIIRCPIDNYFNTFKLLYFANSRQNLTDFVTKDLEVFKYESYSLSQATRLFSKRDQIDTLLQVDQIAEQTEDIAKLDNTQLTKLLKFVPQPKPIKGRDSIADKTVHRRLQRLLLRFARQFERLGELDKALDIYRNCDLPPSGERQARIFDKQGKPEQALKICEALKLSRSENEREFSVFFTTKLLKKLKKNVCTPGQEKIPTEQILLLQLDSLCVEETLASHFRNSGNCFFVENSLINSVFGLCFWETLFSNIPGSFSHPFQSAPHDLYSPDFFSNRIESMNSGWNKLSDYCEHPHHASDIYRAKEGISNPFVHWGKINTEILHTALKRIPFQHWKIIFSRIMKDMKENRSGLPDLIYFPYDFGYEFIEVKGPGDKLQKNQSRWLRFFQQNSIPSRVIHVQWK